MKTASLPLPRHSIINTEPLFLRYEVLAQAMLAMTLTGQFLKAGLAARKVTRLVRVASKLEAHNVQLRSKLKMLSHKQWREKVLKDLGGLRKLIMWEECKARIEARAAKPRKKAKPNGPAWLYTAERIAESERLKARKREVFRANQNPRIVRDRCTVDVEGDFRLAPLPPVTCFVRGYDACESGPAHLFAFAIGVHMSLICPIHATTLSQRLCWIECKHASLGSSPHWHVI